MNLLTFFLISIFAITIRASSSFNTTLTESTNSYSIIIRIHVSLQTTISSESNLGTKIRKSTFGLMLLTLLNSLRSFKQVILISFTLTFTLGWRIRKTAICSFQFSACVASVNLLLEHRVPVSSILMFILVLGVHLLASFILSKNTIIVISKHILGFV